MSKIQPLQNWGKTAYYFSQTPKEAETFFQIYDFYLFIYFYFVIGKLHPHTQWVLNPQPHPPPMMHGYGHGHVYDIATRAIFEKIITYVVDRTLLRHRYGNPNEVSMLSRPTQYLQGEEVPVELELIECAISVQINEFSVLHTDVPQ